MTASRRMPIALAAIIALLLSAVPAGAQDGGSDLIVYAATCPAGYEGTDFFGDCEATAGITFDLGIPGGEVADTQVTDANGNAVFADLAAGAYVVDADLPGDALEDIEIACSVPGATEPRAIERLDLTAIEVEVLAGEELSCTFYVVPAEAGQPTPVSGLPDTGTGGDAVSGGTDGAAVLVLGAALLALLGGLAAARRRTA